jgi:PIN domain nuclease of toxin-antitoxin system
VRVLVDTHALLWWFDGDPKLSTAARKTIDDKANAVLVSAASAWEIATKARIGKLPRALPIARRLPDALEEQGFEPLPVTVLHGHRAGWLSGDHKDPFDRILAAQALIEDLAVITNDSKLKSFGVRTVW